MEIDSSQMISIGELVDDPEDPKALRAFAEEAKKFLESQRWCTRVREGWLERGWPGVLAVFLFAIEPKEGSGAPSEVWVVSGDLPSAYLDAGDYQNGAQVLDAYVGAMEEWVAAARTGRSVEALIPVDIEPTPEHADLLASRLAFIDREILPAFREELS